jgi:hypothetical protein
MAFGYWKLSRFSGARRGDEAYYTHVEDANKNSALI